MLDIAGENSTYSENGGSELAFEIPYIALQTKADITEPHRSPQRKTNNMTTPRTNAVTARYICRLYPIYMKLQHLGQSPSPHHQSNSLIHPPKKKEKRKSIQPHNHQHYTPPSSTVSSSSQPPFQYPQTPQPASSTHSNLPQSSHLSTKPDTYLTYLPKNKTIPYLLEYGMPPIPSHEKYQHYGPHQQTLSSKTTRILKKESGPVTHSAILTRSSPRIASTRPFSNRVSGQDKFVI